MTFYVLGIHIPSLYDAAYTHLPLCLFVTTPLSAWVLISEAVSVWSSTALCVFALSADCRAVPWCDWLIGSIAMTPDRNIQMEE
jgi:hypothetical protein